MISAPLIYFFKVTTNLSRHVGSWLHPPRLFLVFIICVLSQPLAAEFFSEDHSDQDFADTIEESFVAFRFNKTGDNFYRVMMTMDEIPYVNIAEVLERWMEMRVSCDVERRYCQGEMLHNKKIFWLDGEQLLYGNLVSDGAQVETKSLPKTALIEKENILWLRYDLWQEWLPVNIVWSVQSYKLNMQTIFPLKEQRKEIRERARLKQLQRQAQLKALEQTPAIETEKPYAGEMRYSILATQQENGERYLESIYEFGGDVAGGHLVLSGTANSRSGQTDLINFGRYQRIGQEHFHLLELGDTRFDRTLLAPSVEVNRGIRIDRSEQAFEGGSFELQSRTAPNAEIEFIINGFLQETLFADSDGNFEITQRLVSAGDRITLRFYFDDGSQSEQLIEIADDSNMIIKAGSWDGRFVAGETNAGDFVHAVARYGLVEDLSFAGHLYYIPIPSTPAADDQIQDPDYETVFSFDVGWRPFHGLAVLWEGSRQNESFNYSLRGTVSKWQNQTLLFESQKIEAQSLFNTGSIFTYTSLQSHSFEHILSLAPVSYTHLRAHETVLDIVCRLLLEKKN